MKEIALLIGPDALIKLVVGMQARVMMENGQD